MKVISANSNNYDARYRKNNTQIQYACKNMQPAKDSVSFSGLKNGVSGLFEKMGTNFFLQFMVVDLLSMFIPRVWIGLNRDREKTGKLNIKAGAEEAGREGLSGPGMGLIPMGILAAVTHFAPASHMQAETLGAMTSSMNNVVKNATDVKGFVSKEALNKELAGELFDNAFNKFEFKNNANGELKTRFTNLLADSSALKKKELKTKAEEFEKLIAEIHNKNISEKAVDTKAIHFAFDSLEKGKTDKIKTSVGAKDFFKDFHNYSRDVLDKLSKESFGKEPLETAKKNAGEFLNKIQKSRAFTKKATVVAAFFAVGMFLSYLPKLYQQKGLSPAQESAKRAQAEGANGGANENK